MLCEYKKQCGTCTSEGADCPARGFISKIQAYKEILSPALSELRWLEPIKLERRYSLGLDSQV